MKNISCTILGCLHGAYEDLKLEGGDLLILTGDYTARDTEKEYLRFFEWLTFQDYKKIIFIGGNHDNYLASYNPTYANHIEYLCDSGTEYQNLKIWGSPWSLTFPRMNKSCKAFTCDTEEEIQKKWDLIPSDTDILITHTPLFGILDGIEIEDGSLFHVGSKSLRDWLEKKTSKPKLFCFSHIHEGYGELIYKREGYGDENNTLCINASIMNEYYKPVNKPQRVLL